jgi:hypothetical protein
MMEATYTIPTDEGRKQQLLDKATREAVGVGISLVGDVHGGTFKGTTVLGVVEGSYSITKDHLYITLTRKPAIVPAAMLRRLFASLFKEE